MISGSISEQAFLLCASHLRTLHKWLATSKWVKRLGWLTQRLIEGNCATGQIRNIRTFTYIFQKHWILGTHRCILMYIDVYLCFFMFLHCLVKVLGCLVVHFVCFLPFWVCARVIFSCPFYTPSMTTIVFYHGGDVSSVPVRDSPPPPLPALRANLVAKGQQLLAIHIVAPKALENFFSFPLPILSTLHPNIILEPNLDSNAHPNP